MPSPIPPPALSDREREVLFLAAEGLTDKEIAVHLAIRTKTVRTYWDRIRGKLNAASRTQALALALRAANEELAEKEERLRTFVQAMPVAFFAFDENLTVLASNDEGEKLTGYSQQEIVGTRLIYSRVIPEEVRRTQMVREWLTRGGEFREWEVPIVRRDGKRRIVSWSSDSRHHPVPGWRTWAVGVDVTPFREAEDKLRFLVESVDQGIWLLDINLQTQTVNRRMAEILGEEVESLYGMSPKDFIAREDLPGAQRVFTEGGRERFAFRFRRRNGEFCHVTKTLRPVLDGAGATIGFLILVSVPER